jgi:hypothetical protein
VHRNRTRFGFLDVLIGRDPLAHVVPDLSDALDRLSLRVFQRPVPALQAGHYRARFATSHRDEHRGSGREVISQLLRHDAIDLDPNLTHRRDDLGVHAGPRLGTGGDGARPVPIGQRVEPCGRHLRPSGVVDACKKDCLHGFVPIAPRGPAARDQSKQLA